MCWRRFRRRPESKARTNPSNLNRLRLFAERRREKTMPTELASTFRAELNRLHHALLALSPALADTPWRAGGWTRKQIVGHLLDSAANNRQRFVRASMDGS